MATTNLDWYRSVKLQMNLEEVKSYTPFHKGLDINFYPPLDEKGQNLLFKKGYNKKKIDAVDVTITAKSLNPDPLHARDMRDIDDELARMDSTYRVLKDHLKHTDNKELVHSHQPVNTLIRHATILDHPYLDGENDKYRSTATEVHKVQVPLEDIRNLENKFEKRKAFYNRSKLNFVQKLNRKTNEKVGVFDMGIIGN